MVPPLHAVIVACPAQGHFNPIMNLAQLLAMRGFFITFVTTEWMDQRLLKAASKDAAARDREIQESGFKFRFIAIPDGLPPEHGRTSEPGELWLALQTLGPALESVLTVTDKSVPPITCIISDSFLSCTVEVAKNLGVPRVIFWTTCTAYAIIQKNANFLLSLGHIPVKEMESDWIVDPGVGCFYVIDKQAEVSDDEAESDDEAKSVIEKFLGSLDSVESDVQVKVGTKCHWWDGWKSEETSTEEEEGLLYSLFEEETSLFPFQDEKDASRGEEDVVSNLENEDDPEEEQVDCRSDDLLLQIAEVEAEWNALIARFSSKPSNLVIETSEGAKDSVELAKVDGIPNKDILLRGSTRARDFGGGVYYASTNSSVPDYGLPEKVVREYVFNSDLTWRRLIRTVHEQSLAILKSSQELVVV